MILGFGLLVACGPAARDDDGPAPDDVVALTVVADATSVTITNRAPVAIRVRATATTAAGELQDVSDRVRWDLDAAWGTVAADRTGAEVTFTGAQTGVGTIQARLDELVDEAPIEVFARRVIIDPALPAAIETSFATATLHPDQLELAYPAADTVVPPNLTSFEVHTHRVADRAYYRTRARAAYRTVELYAPATPNANQIATLAADVWQFVADGARDASVTIDVGALAEGSALLMSTPTRTIRIAGSPLEGGLYYFGVDDDAAADVGSLLRLDVGQPGAVAEEFVDVLTLGATCVGCHAVSRDGRKLAMVLDAPHGEAAVMDLSTRSTTPLDAAVATTFMAFSPDGSRLVATHTSGNLSVLDTATGALLAELDTGGHRATQPDWSPAGDAIVWTSYDDEVDLMRFAGGGDLWVTPIDPATLASGRPTQLTDEVAPTRAYYPSFSPDGAWILFNRSEEDSFDDGSARVWVVPATGDAPPAQLGTGSFEGTTALSGPRWAPFATTADGGEPVYWFTVTTREIWGVRDWTFTPQLWMAAFFPERVGVAGDAAAPLFHLPGQGDRHNHFAQWTTRIIDLD